MVNVQLWDAIEDGLRTERRKVRGSNTPPSAIAIISLQRKLSISSTMESPAFQRACEGAGIPATRRQAAKFLQRRGKAFTWARSHR